MKRIIFDRDILGNTAKDFQNRERERKITLCKNHVIPCHGVQSQEKSSFFKIVCFPYLGKKNQDSLK